MSATALLFLADGRFPDGTHAHSFGLEAAVAAGRVSDAGSLAEYVACRLWTVGRTDAAAARMAAAGVNPDALDAAWCVRTPSAAARVTSRALGRVAGADRGEDRAGSDDRVVRRKPGGAARRLRHARRCHRL